MEPDSTTGGEMDVDLFEPTVSDRENLMLEELARHHELFRYAVRPLLPRPGAAAAASSAGGGRRRDDEALLDWMKRNELLRAVVRCGRCRAVRVMTWTPAKKAVDGRQWRCADCSHRANVRDGSFFRGVFCSLAKALKLIAAWCEDVECDSAARVFDVKRSVVATVYEKIERVIATRPINKLGGPESVILVELYPEMVDEMYPVSSKNEVTKTQQRILCMTDTSAIPTQYYLHVITGTYPFPSRNNNNTQAKKANLCEEVLNVVEAVTYEDGLVAVGGGGQLAGVLDVLKDSDKYVGATCMSNLSAHSMMNAFMTGTLWKPVIELCEAAQDLPKAKMQTYLNSALWRWETDVDESYATVLRLISEHDFEAPTTSSKSRAKN